MRHPVISGCLAAAFAVATAQADDRDDRGVRTATPVKHLVVIFQENISYDHYFGTYPHAQNNPGETPFKASKHTPINNNLLTPLDVNHGFRPLVGVNLLTNNPNSNPNAPAGAQQPAAQRHRCGQSVPAVAQPGVDRRPGPQRHARAGRLQQRSNGRFPGLGRDRRRYGNKRPAAAARCGRHQGTDDGLLRWQHRHGVVELRPALRDERQQLLEPVRSVVAWRPQPDLRPGQRLRPRHQGAGRQRQPAASDPRRVRRCRHTCRATSP